mmetsp:Transcript_17637/g.50507  ORF Transcript_17637/g.50507 Transcript_17637/m.50507 type:complete len:209 (+) Transcript_17637:273-899(+)
MELDNPVSSGSAMEVEQAIPSSSGAVVQTGASPGAAAGSALAPVSSAAGAAAAAASITVGGGENAAELKFGQDFEDIHILSNAQVAVILQVSAKSAGARDEELNEVYRKTQKYVERFNTMTNDEKEHQELVDELDNLQDALTTFRKETDDGQEMELHGSEVAALMNLVATDTMVEEAVALIPSLSRFPEAAIDEILDLIRSTMIRIVS